MIGLRNVADDLHDACAELADALNEDPFEVEERIVRVVRRTAEVERLKKRRDLAIKPMS